jgi:uncharacterized protein (DUF952 family)
MIYHITTPSEFAKFDDKDYYEAVSLHTEGFIHCSTLIQLKATAERYHSKTPEILALSIDEQKLSSDLEYELAGTGEEFPHIYGRINKNAIVEQKIYANAGGTFNIEIN